MKLFHFILINIVTLGSWSLSHGAHAPTARSCLLNAHTYIGNNIEFTRATVNVWQVMQGVEALTLLFNVQEKDVQQRLEKFPLPVKDLMNRVLKKLKKTYPKFLSDRTMRDNKYDNVDEHNTQAWYAIEADQSTFDMIRAIRSYLFSNPRISKDAKDYMQLHGFLWMLLSTLAHGFSFGDSYEGVRSSLMVGGINLVESVAVESISNYAHFSDQGRCYLHGGVKLGLLCVSLCAQLMSSIQQGNEPDLPVLGGQPQGDDPIVPHPHVLPPAPPMPPMAPPPPPPFAAPKPARLLVNEPSSFAAQLERKKLKAMTAEEIREAEEKRVHKNAAAQNVFNPVAGIDLSKVKLKKTTPQSQNPQPSDELNVFIKPQLRHVNQNEKRENYKGNGQLAVEDRLENNKKFLALREASKGDDERKNEGRKDIEDWDDE